MGSILKEYKTYQQNLESKYGHNSVVLLMVGSFYEMYAVSNQFGKVEEVSKILNILQTRKDKSQPHSSYNPYLCGFPVHSLGKHLLKLLQSRFTVAIYNQFDIENSKKKCRKLVNIYSPSTYIDEEIVENNELMAVHINTYRCPIQKRKIRSCSITCIDLSTGKNRIYSCTDSCDEPDKVSNEVTRILYMIHPCEILTNLKDTNEIFQLLKDSLIHRRPIDKKFFDLTYQNTFLKKIFGSNPHLSPIEAIQLEKYPDIIACYIYLLQFAYEHDPRIIKRIQKPEFLFTQNDLILNNDALFELNLIPNSQGNKYKSLLDVINCTYTKMGERLLKARLFNPITSSKILNERYDAIQDMMKDNKYKKHQEQLNGIGDLEKKYRKLVLQRLHPFEFARLSTSFERIENLIKKEGELSPPFLKFLNDYKETFDLEVMGKYNLTNIDASFFKRGLIPDLDQLYKKMSNIIRVLEDAASQISNHIEKGYDRLVRLDHTEKDGFFLTTTAKRWQLFNKKEEMTIRLGVTKSIESSTLTIKKLSSGIRIFHSIFDKYWGIYGKLKSRIRSIVKKEYFKKLKYYEQEYGQVFEQLITFIAELDVVCSCAKVSIQYCYTRPQITDQSEKSYVNTKGLRHPLIERIQDDQEYITNDMHVVNGTLLYGINAGGKSSLLRAVGCNVILAQMGMYVSAVSFEFTPYHRLLTKISTLDNLFKGKSTFVCEMLELKHILQVADHHSLILCDELTAGTETSSATGIVASAILSLLKKNANFIFTTHLHGLMDFQEITENDKLIIFHFSIDITSDKVKYKYTLLPGSGDSTYGIEIAKALGLESDFIKDAFKFRKDFNHEPQALLQNKRSRYNSKVIMDSCANCGVKASLQTHHLHEQAKADENGIIKHFHKNIRHNLKVLCEKCHQKQHTKK